MPHRDLKLIDAAKRAAVMVIALIDRSPDLLYARQMRDAVQSIRANIAEGFGRGTGRDGTGRDLPRSLTMARGEAEETITHLDTNYQCGLLSAKEYWPPVNLLKVIVKMLNAFLR